MEEDTSGVSQAFSFPNGGGSEGNGEGFGSQDVEEVKGCGSRGLMSGSVRKAAEKVESISAGRRGGGPPKKPMAFCASRESSASLRGSPPVPALVCSLSPVRIWRQERGRLAARAVKPAWPPCWPSSMIESLTLAIKSGMAE